MEEARSKLGEHRSFITNSRNEIQSILLNPLVTEWQRVDFSLLLPISEALCLPPGVKEARENYRQKAQNIFYHLERIENDVGNLEADLVHQGTLNPNVDKELEKIGKSRATLAAPLESIKKDAQLLINVDRLLRDSLTFLKILPLARTRTQFQNNFDIGIQVYKSATCAEDEKDAQGNMYDLFLEAVRIEERLNAIKPTDFPVFPTSILLHQISITLLGAVEIKNYIDYIKDSLKRDMEPVAKIKQQLCDIRDKPLPTLISLLIDLSESISKVILSYSHQAQILDRLEFVSAMLSDLHFITRAINKEVQSRLHEGLSLRNSPINIDNHAASIAKFYFSGIRGMGRILRLLFSALSGGSFISENELKEKMTVVLENCSLFYGNAQSDIENIENYIDRHLPAIKKPFPYDGLFTLMKTNIITYGEKLEAFVFRLELALPDESETANIPSSHNKDKRKTTFGNLIKKIEIKTDNLKKAQTE